MKKISVVLLILVFLFNSTSAFSASCFSNNSALDAAFAQMEKAFMAYEQENYTIELTPGGKSDFVAKMLPEMPNEAIKAAVTKQLNITRVNIELQEEKLGGLTKEDYQKISAQLIEGIKINNGFFRYEDDLKTVYLSFGIGGSEFEDFYDLTGNFVSMGPEKDKVCPADLEVKSKVARYLEQSKQLGNKIAPQVVNKLPEMTDRLFKELRPSKIAAARAISTIHWNICVFDPDDYDGSRSVESIIETFEYILSSKIEDREDEMKFEYFEFPDDEPSPEAREHIAKLLVEEKLSEYFNRDFDKPITLDELARLYFEDHKVSEDIELEKGTIDPDAPDYIKCAFIFGMIDDDKDLDKPLTRLEAARRLVNGIIYWENGVSTTLRFLDCEKVPFADLVTVANCASNSCGMSTDGMYFRPQDMYTRQDAIMDKRKFNFYNIRAYEAPISLFDPSKIIVGKNTVHMLFEDRDEIEEYIADYFEDSPIGSIKRNGRYMRIDTGCALLEFFTPENGIKFTFKNGVKYIDFDEGVYGPQLQYIIEPRLLKSDEKVDMNMQIDSAHKKLNSKLDAILAKIIKADMTEEQKVKAIHDFVVTHITYDLNYCDDESIEDLILTIDKGRGVCADYTMLFQYLCDRASIPCISESGYVSSSGDFHAWNVVLLNGQWKFVDATWDDDNPKKISYKYYLVDKFTFMKDHTPMMGVPDEIYCPEIDGMNIKSQDELRIYLLQKFYWIDGFKVTFRMADKTMKPDIPYLWNSYGIKVALTYDSKQDLYTVAAKAR